jgi:glycosyltransferase involved in cell wall biosynthesis
LGERLVQTTFLQNIPGATKYFRLMAPFYFHAFQSLDLQDYDLIISSSTCFAKAVQKRPGAIHICFCHNVTRFLWDKTYLQEYGDFRKFSFCLIQIFKFMRNSDFNHAQGPDFYIANSSVVAKRIRKIYKKPTTRINYPIDESKFVFKEAKKDFYLVSARLLGYKRIDVIIEAFNQLGWPLKILGNGPERKRLEFQALKNKNIEFLGFVSDAERARLMSEARSVIVMALEDYGLVPVEANASGTPVIAYGAGGVLDTQVPGKTGIFFKEQTPDALKSALLEARKISWDYEQIRSHAISNFSRSVFFNQIEQVMEEVCSHIHHKLAPPGCFCLRERISDTNWVK